MAKRSKPPARKVGTSAPTKPVIKALRAETALLRLAQGKTGAEVAKELNMSRATLYRTLAWAEAEGIVGELRNRVREEIAPKAVRAYEDALNVDPKDIDLTAVKAHQMKLSAAKDIAFGTGVLKKKEDAIQQTEELSLEWFHQQRAQKGLHGQPTAAAIEVTDALPAVSADVRPGADTEGASSIGADADHPSLREGAHGGDDPQRPAEGDGG